MKFTITMLSVFICFSLLAGCSSTYQVAYPPASDMFVTMGDDPGTESVNAYTPKGTFVHTSSEFHIPFPLLGLIPFGNAEPNYVFETYVLPQVSQMGGDSLTNARIQHTPRPGFFARLTGLAALKPSVTTVYGQVVKK